MILSMEISLDKWEPKQWIQNTYWYVVYIGLS